MSICCAVYVFHVLLQYLLQQKGSIFENKLLLQLQKTEICRSKCCIFSLAKSSILLTTDKKLACAFFFFFITKVQ